MLELKEKDRCERCQMERDVVDCEKLQNVLSDGICFRVGLIGESGSMVIFMLFFLLQKCLGYC